MITPTIESMTVDPATSQAWVVLAGFDQARLMHYHSPTARQCRGEEVDRAQCPLPAEGYAPPRTYTGQPDQRYADRCRILEEERRRFSRFLYRWLKSVVKQRRLNHITLFAPPRMIHLLESLKQDLRPAVVDLLPSDLTDQTDDKLRAHPAIMGRLQPQSDARTHQSPPAKPASTRVADQQLSDPMLRKTYA